MLSEKMEASLNGQLNAELFASYLYLSASAYFRSVNLDGMAHWMALQSQEETEHAMKFYEFIIQRGGRVRLDRIEAPQVDWDSPLAVFESALAHERKVTGWINDLVDLAMAERDHATTIFLQWFVTEQVEEEENTDGVVQKLTLAGDQQGLLFMLDRELGQRPGGAGEADET